MTALHPGEPHLTDRVAANVRQLMGRYKVNQRTLCQWLHLTQGTVSKKCSGAQTFTLAEIEILAARFGVAEEQFLKPVMDELPPFPGGMTDGHVTHRKRADWPVTALAVAA